MASTRLVDKADSDERSLRLAVLIDADNAQATVIEGLLAEIATFGEATVKRIYGDFTAPASSSWKKVLQRYAIKPVQQFAYTTGKNATDRLYGYKKLSDLVKAKNDLFVTEERQLPGANQKVLYLRAK